MERPQDLEKGHGHTHGEAELEGYLTQGLYEAHYTSRNTTEILTQARLEYARAYKAHGKNHQITQEKANVLASILENHPVYSDKWDKKGCFYK